MNLTSREGETRLRQCLVVCGTANVRDRGLRFLSGMENSES